jgi:putative nucleotidyltransferase with HDIG domain
VGGLLAVVLPLLLIRYSYLSASQLQQANRDLLRVLIKAIETRDPYTSGHSLRVSTLAKMIAEDHGLRARLVSQVADAALLHDIGKIDALYAEIISKPAALTDHERSVIQTHATKGADLLQSLTSLEKEIIVGVRHHHEHFDGSGYPSGLQGKSIPIAARIIMICDSVDAMLSDRPYRDALTVEQVNQELRACSGTQFDPELVETILQCGTLPRAELLVDRSGARAAVRVVAG